MTEKGLARAAFALAVLLLLIVWPASAGAQDARKARAHARQAKAYFDAGDFTRAAEEYQAAHDLDKRPTRLYNIAVCHERNGDREQALNMYRRYLQLDPDGQGAQAAAESVAALERELAAAAGTGNEARAPDAATAMRAQARLWWAAEAYRQAGDRVRAADHYRRYLASGLIGEHTLEARLWLEDLTGAVAKTNAAGASMSTTAVAADAPDRSTAKRRDPSLLVLAGVAIAAGVLLDLTPASANNGDFDGMDLAPIGCYGLGLALAASWAF
jgi:tetratricopeptide (TPR) repeat protein